MIRHLMIFAILASILFCPFDSSVAQDQEPIAVWRQFVSALRTGGLAEDKIRLYPEVQEVIPPAAMLKILSGMKEKANWDEWQAIPEIHRLGTTIHYLIPLTFDNRKDTYCFTFVLEGGQWYFRHLESITIRLDQIGTLPVSKFPDVSEQQKAWMRQERHMQAQTDLFNFLSKEKGKEFAFDWFRDGPGYFVEAKTWVPFVPPQRAFILYLCWEQSNLQGNRVTLQKLDDNEALLTLEATYQKLYDQTSIQQKIDYADYRKMFEVQWQDRATAAGWNLELTCNKTECTFHFRSRNTTLRPD